MCRVGPAAAAAALAAGLVLGAIGTDTGGSIRNPAAYCGITGLKPTYGRVSRYGIVTLSWSLDHAGPMARTAADVAVLLTALAGYDPRDPASAKVPAEDYTASLEQSVAGLRLAVPTNFFFEEITEEARSAFDAAVDVLRGLGATVEELHIPHGELAAFSQPSCCRRRTRITPKTWPSCRRNTCAVAQPAEGWRPLPGLGVRAGAARTAHLAGGLPGGAAPLRPDAHPARQETPRYEEMIAPDYKRGPSYTGAYNLTGLPSLAVPAGFSGRGR